MKTTNNVQKTNLKSAATVVVLAVVMVLSNAVSATGYNLSAMNAYLTEETEEALELENWMTNENNFYASLALEAETENAMELESWMTNANNFFSTVSLESETEEALEVENWMTNESNFYNTVSLETEVENTLEVEEWMKNDSVFNKTKNENENEKQETVKKEKEEKKSFGTGYTETNFGRRAFIMYEEPEDKLKLETWMVDYKYWNGK
jgi:hypothetical protein